MEKKKIWKDESVQAGVLILAAFLLLTAWAFMQPLGAGPDEKMRYMVAQYLHEHPGKLPLGDEPTIRDATWGISYAYYPILSYMVSAVFMGIAGLFHASADGLLHAARMADVLFVTGAVYFVVKASGKLFPKEGRWLFAVLAGFMPQALFLGTCKHGFPGAFIHGDDPVFLVLLSGSGRLELQKFDPSGCWNGSLCTVLL